MDEVSSEISSEKMVRAYIKMRDRRTEMKQAWEAQDEAIKEQMEIIERALLEKCKTAGGNISTSVGVVIQTVKTNYWTNDWDAMHTFIKENITEEFDALNLLERRISQKSMGEFLKANPDKMPKGLNVDSRYAVVVRRK